MFKRIIMAAVVVVSFALVSGTADTADAWRGRRVWRRPVVVAPRVVVRRPYVAPLRYGVGYRPYYAPRVYGGYYGPRVYVGW